MLLLLFCVFLLQFMTAHKDIVADWEQSKHTSIINLENHGFFTRMLPN